MISGMTIYRAGAHDPKANVFHFSKAYEEEGDAFRDALYCKMNNPSWRVWIEFSPVPGKGQKAVWYVYR